MLSTPSAGPTPAPAAPPAATLGWPRPRLYWLAGLAAAQGLVLLGIAALAWATASQGQVVQLRTRPLDPRDAMYGDYARLHYLISDLAPTLWRGPGRRPDFGRAGQRVFVRLAPGGRGWVATGIYGQRPAAGAGPAAMLPGTVEGLWGGSVHLRYGLERLYLPAGPHPPGPARDTAGLLVRVAVAPWGSVRLLGTE